MPYNLVTVKAGIMLSELGSMSEVHRERCGSRNWFRGPVFIMRHLPVSTINQALDAATMAKLAVLSLLALAPVLLKKRLKLFAPFSMDDKPQD